MMRTAIAATTSWRERNRQPGHWTSPTAPLGTRPPQVPLRQSAERAPEANTVLPEAEVQTTPGATVSTPAEALSPLFQRMAQGDEQALAALYDATNALVYGLACRILRDDSAAQDVLIEVYTQVYQQASHYDPQRGTPLTWLLTLTRSRALDRRRIAERQQQREAPLTLAATCPADTPDPEACSVAGEVQQIIRTALSHLSPPQRQVIEMAYYEGYSHSEIATRLGRPLGTVKTQLRLGMLTLRRVVGPLFAEPPSCSLPH